MSRYNSTKSKLLVFAAMIICAAIIAGQGYQIPINQGDSMTAMRNKSNEAFETLRSNFSGPTAPTYPPPVDGQWWFDEANTIVRYFYDGTWRYVPAYQVITANVNGLLYAGSEIEISAMSPLTDGQLPIGRTGMPPIGATITGTADETDVTLGTGTIQIGLVNPLKLAKGGTGLSSATAGDMLTYVSGTAYTALAKGTANQILGMNNGATTQEYKTVTAGTGVSVTHGTNSITLGIGNGTPKTAAPTVITHADLTEAANGVPQVKTITIPARTFCKGFAIIPTVAFSGGGVSALTLDIDSTFFAALPITGYDLMVAPGPTNFAQSIVSFHIAKSLASYTVDLTFQSDGGHSLADLTAGSMEIYLELETLP